MSEDFVVEVDLAGRDAAAIESILEGALERDAARVVLLHVDGAMLGDHARLWPLQRYALPVVASITREAVGGVYALATGCDIRVAAGGAKIGPGSVRAAEDNRERTEVLLGVKPALALKDDSVWTAEVALQHGLVSALTPSGQAVAEARRVAAVIAARGPIATRLAKEAVWRGLPQPLEQALRFETDLTLLLQTTKDRAEGVAAFVQKREPRFTGE